MLMLSLYLDYYLRIYSYLLDTQLQNKDFSSENHEHCST